MYDNEFEKRKIKFKPRIKLNHNIYSLFNRMMPLVPEENIQFLAMQFETLQLHTPENLLTVEFLSE